MYRVRLLLVALAAFLLGQPASAQAPAGQKAVLVTGASSGIGLEITEYLSARGFHVYATARKAEDLKRLDAMANVSSLRLDVTKQAEVDAAVKFVAAQGRGLFGVINNAGVASAGELTKTTDADILWQHDINVMGPLRVNRAFAEMLKASKGRTAIIGSLSGFAVRPGSGGYSMTKFATEAYTDTLAMELKEAGVAVGIIDPGSFRSLAREKVVTRMLTGSADLDQQLTDEQKKVIAAQRAEESKRPEPVVVAEQVHHFLASDSPRLRYMAAPDKETADRVMRVTLARTLQLNASQAEYSLGRDELVRLLDEILAQQASGRQ
ncbi:SDR family NAD(P)-dependent oxidoreductase [Sphingosinicella rhizophila]|uniref:SDR family NAD(P)-dependent oxidoreductase n=1 Tax=Sphingosinicella rhizophila TaxID=3050082 RepID=A0ABU3QBK8_9SPHN|nr:SDR family NAD(P)-dependent oxidoreductase [Sphingosinicella sp. GR2756]MDT9600766.1 SDR family NAD(P)-dependent oxidoreductase [Sphingosinicella sp. GR2756]